MNGLTFAERITRKVTKFDHGKQHVISIPEKWIKEIGETDTVVMYLGDLIIIANLADERHAEVASKLLVEKKLMTPLITERPKLKRTRE